ncbi:HEAT repeat-containing protein 6 [Halotydeus destructor]|nr:HEAT repeat-containing protein 6 [Halotydeus destructor]
MDVDTELVGQVNRISDDLVTVNAVNYNSFVDRLIDIAGYLVGSTRVNHADSVASLLDRTLSMCDVLLKSKTHPHVKTTLANLHGLLACVSQGSNLLADQVAVVLKSISSCLKKLDINSVSPEKISAAQGDTMKCLFDYLGLALRKHNSNDEQERLKLLKLFLASVQVVKSILRQFKAHSLEDHQILSPMLSILNLFIFVGSPGYDLSKVKLVALYASPLNMYIPQGNVSNESSLKNQTKRSNRRKSKSRKDTGDDDDAFLQRSDPSDSEMSSSEFDYNNLPDMRTALREISSKIRYSSFQQLEVLVRVAEKRAMFSYWSSFIPDAPVHSGPSVLTTVQKDSSNKARMCSLNFLNELIANGRQYIVNLAESSDRKTNAFTPLSVTLSCMVLELHKMFYGFLFIETEVEVLSTGLRTLVTLISSSPYSKLDKGMASQLMKKLSVTFSSSRNNQVLSATLSAIVALLENESANLEVREYFATEEGSKSKLRLETFALDQLEQVRDLNLTVECLKLLSCSLKLEPNSVLADKSMNISLVLCENKTASSNDVLQVSLCKFIYSIAGTVKNLAESETELNWWQKIIGASLVNDLLSADDPLANQASVSLILDSLSLMKSATFDKLPKHFTLHLVVLVFSKSDFAESFNSGQCQVISSAVRCLGIYSEFDVNQDDWTFQNDVAGVTQRILMLMVNRSTINPRDLQTISYQAAWTCACVSETIKKSLLNELDGFELSFALNYLETVLNAFNQCGPGVHGDQIRTNLVRAMTNLVLPLLSFEEPKKQINDAIGRTIDVLIDSLAKGKTFKLQWNCCCSLQTLLENSNIVNVPQFEAVCIKLKTVLIKVSTTSKNHKLMIYCVSAMAAVCQYLDSNTRIELVNVACSIFIAKFHSVPQILLDKFTEKFLNSIKSMETLCELESPCLIELEEFKKVNEIVYTTD